ncbi:MAG: hypothetical protein IID36_06295, partial [Planctomycetes bacterium]|nr:hypothetical protein [Planctomycetota bacterium]
AGREFAGQGTTCLDDPCESGVGACCNSGSCDDVSPEECAADGGEWLGAGTNCAGGLCAPGACCLPGACEDTVQFECDDLEGTFVAGTDCAIGSCDVVESCPADSLFAQTPDDAFAFTAFLSENAAGFQRWDRFVDVPGAIEAVRWFGFDLIFSGGDFDECEDFLNQFQIDFHEDDGGMPGRVVCSYFEVAENTPTSGDFQGFVLNEYNLTLPTACALTHGWISIVGDGLVQCWFYWMSSSDGDGTSICDNCVNPNEVSDLSFCLTGEAGGVFGACCDEATGMCTDGVEISDCTALDERFVVDATCESIDPPCDPITGACCFGDGACSVIGEISCADQGGNWLGGASVCDDCPPIGACCQGNACTLLTEPDCASEILDWLGPGTTCEECPEVPVCPGDSLFGQSPDSPKGDITAGTSEETAGFKRFDDFMDVGGAIETLTWWGLDLDHIEGTNNFEECVESDPTFEITFHVDAAGVPGDTVCSYILTSTYTPTGVLYEGAELNEYSVELDPPCVVPTGWVSIVGQGDPDCWFLWMSAGPGASYCQGCAGAFQSFNLAICMDGTEGGVFGACCDDVAATCDDQIEITACLDPALRFEADQFCEDIDPPCGVIIGACCRPDSVCDSTEQDECDAQGGSWLGADTSCVQCPCVLSCESTGSDEGEPPCKPGYLDLFNGGCDALIPFFSPIEFCKPICGESGVFEFGDDFIPDEDWYEVFVKETTELTWTVEAEFSVGVWIIDGNGGCASAAVLDSLGSDECDSVSVSAVVDPGLYWLVVSPMATGDLEQCGARYVATLTRPAMCFGDFDGDGAIKLADYAVLAECMAGPNALPAPAPPITSEDCLATFDLDFDDDVDLADFGRFAGIFEGTPP